MNCSEIEERLSAYVDGEADAGERAALEGHLATCADCARSLEGLRLQDRDLDAAFSPLRAEAEAMAGRVIARLPGARRARPVLWFALALSHAAVFLAAFLAFRPKPPVPHKDEGPAMHGPELALVKKPMARLAVATGAIEVRAADGAWAPLATGGGIEAGAALRTSRGTKGSFDFNDGTEIRLNERTEVVIHGPRRVTLAEGQIFTRVAPHPKVRFTVATDQAAIEAVGTTLDIFHGTREVDPKPKEGAARRVTSLVVLEGAARLLDQAVSAGQICRVVDGRVEPPSPARDLTVLTRWVHEILVLRDPGNVEFHGRVNDLLARIGRTKLEHLYEGEIRALGDHAALPLTRYVQSPESRKEAARRQTAARILADIASAPSVPDFVALLRDEDPAVRASIARGLQRLTGQTLGFAADHWSGPACVQPGGGAAAWEAWLRDHRDVWGAPRPDERK
jgi:hypothetical protein